MPPEVPITKTTELQTFSYHSGAQISVWFDDIWVNDISSITWQYSQEKRPLYGYASTYFDAVSRGQVIVQGSFTINFRQRDYISLVIENIRRLEKDIKSWVSPSEAEDRWQSIRPIISSHLRNGTFGPSSVEDIIALGRSENFWETVDGYEAAIWDTLNEQEDFYRDTPDVLQHRNFSQGFDINIVYGHLSDERSATPYDVMSSTKKILKGVHLTGSTQIIQATGEPIQEGYSFFAKDIR